MWADNSGFCWWQAHCRFSEAGKVWQSMPNLGSLGICSWKFLRISMRGTPWVSRVIWTWLHSLGAPNSTNRRGAKYLRSTLSFASQWFSRENYLVYAWMGLVMVLYGFMLFHDTRIEEREYWWEMWQSKLYTVWYTPHLPWPNDAKCIKCISFWISRGRSVTRKSHSVSQDVTAFLWQRWRMLLRSWSAVSTHRSPAISLQARASKN